MPFAVHAGIFHYAEQLFLRHYLFIVQPVAVGGFAEEVIALREKLRTRQYMTLRPTDIAGIGHTLPAFGSRLYCTLYLVFLYISLIYLQAANSSSQHVSGIGEGQQYIIEEPETAVVTIGDEELHRAVHIVLVIEGFYLVPFTFLLVRILPVDLLVVHANILLLNERRIGEHQGAQIARSRRAVDIALETHLHYVRDQPRMVDMRMAQHNAIQLRRIKTQVPVRRVRLHTFTLIHTAVQQDCMTRIGCDQMLASRHLASGS